MIEKTVLIITHFAAISIPLKLCQNMFYGFSMDQTTDQTSKQDVIKKYDFFLLFSFLAWKVQAC